MNSYFEGRETISLNENFEFNKMELARRLTVSLGPRGVQIFYLYIVEFAVP